MSVLTFLAFLTIIVAASAVQENAQRPPDNPAEATIRKLEQEWEEAYRKCDHAYLERTLADDYVFTVPDGTVLDRKRQIEDLKSGNIATEFKLSELRVRVYGDAAVVTGKSTVKGKRNDQDITGAYRFTKVYVKRSPGWQCVAAHATRIASP